MIRCCGVDGEAGGVGYGNAIGFPVDGPNSFKRVTWWWSREAGAVHVRGLHDGSPCAPTVPTPQERLTPEATASTVVKWPADAVLKTALAHPGKRRPKR